MIDTGWKQQGGDWVRLLDNRWEARVSLIEGAAAFGPWKWAVLERVGGPLVRATYLCPTADLGTAKAKSWRAARRVAAQAAGKGDAPLLERPKTVQDRTDERALEIAMQSCGRAPCHDSSLLAVLNRFLRIEQAIERARPGRWTQTQKVYLLGAFEALARVDLRLQTRGANRQMDVADYTKAARTDDKMAILAAAMGAKVTYSGLPPHLEWGGAEREDITFPAFGTVDLRGET